MSQLFACGDQSIGASALAAVLPKNIQGWFPSGLTGLIYLLTMGFSRVFTSTTIQKHQFCSTQLCSALRCVQLSHLYVTTGKAIVLTIWTFVGKMMSLLFSMLSRFVIAFLPRSSIFLPLQWCHLHIWGWWYFSQKSWFQLVILLA